MPSFLAFLLVSLPIVVSQQNRTCISNYAQLKEALFDESTGNMERLLYSVQPPNQRVPHYLWVYYLNSQSSNWSDILACPETSILPRCPIDNTDTDSASSSDSKQANSNGNEVVGIIFWADSPFLISFDIPLLKAYTLDTLLNYLGDGACVELVIPRFCPSVSNETKSSLLQFATSWVGSKPSNSYLHCDICIHA